MTSTWNSRVYFCIYLTEVSRTDGTSSKIVMAMINGFLRALMTAVALLPALQTARASSLTPWPYLQVYPPVNESDGRTPLYFALMLSFGGQLTSIGALPGVQIALDYINSQSDILPGYSLHYTLTDSQVIVSGFSFSD